MGASSVLGPALSLVAAFGTPLTIVTAGLVYFGWQRSYLGTRLLGLDTTLFELTTQFYVLGSIRTLWLPMLVVTAIGIGWLLLHERAVGAIQARRLASLRVLVRGLKYGLAASLALGLVAGWMWPGWRGLVVPLSFTVGVLTTTYGIVLQRRITAALGLRQDTETLATWHLPAIRIVIGLLIVLPLFLALSNYANMVGSMDARQLIAGLPDRVGVIVYSAKNLQIDAPGVRETRFAGETSAYGYRYDGLRLLQKSGDKYFLLPTEWNLEEGKAIVLTDDNTIRLEFTTPQFSNAAGGSTQRSEIRNPAG
ncbi:hypothetical protein [Flindersiella endophytica]